MKAILLAAGLGTRLKPITDNIPKCLVAINGKPLLAYWLETLVNLGVTKILINIHYLPEQVEEFIKQSPYKNYITTVEEIELLGTAGTLVNNRSFWQSETTLIIHADNFCCSDLTSMVKQHHNRPAETDATLLLFKTEQPKSCGVVKVDENKVIREFHEKVDNPPSNLASGALFIFSPNVFDKYFRHFEDNKHYELSLDVVPKMVNKLQGWQVDSFYIDIGTPETLALANAFMK